MGSFFWLGLDELIFFFHFFGGHFNSGCFVLGWETWCFCLECFRLHFVFYVFSFFGFHVCSSLF